MTDEVTADTTMSATDPSTVDYVRERALYMALGHVEHGRWKDAGEVVQDAAVFEAYLRNGIPPPMVLVIDPADGKVTWEPGKTGVAS